VLDRFKVRMEAACSSLKAILNGCHRHLSRRCFAWTPILTLYRISIPSMTNELCCWSCQSYSAGWWARLPAAMWRPFSHGWYLHAYGGQLLTRSVCVQQEATELSELFRRVEAVFAGGDVAAIAALLSRMRASLALVGHVPEFAGGLERLEVRPQPWHLTVGLCFALLNS